MPTSFPISNATAPTCRQKTTQIKTLEDECLILKQDLMR